MDQSILPSTPYRVERDIVRVRECHLVQHYLESDCISLNCIELFKISCYISHCARC